MIEPSFQSWVHSLDLSLAARNLILENAECLGEVLEAPRQDLEELASVWSPTEKAHFLGAVESLRALGSRIQDLEDKLGAVTKERDDALVSIQHLQQQLEAPVKQEQKIAKTEGGMKRKLVTAPKKRGVSDSAWADVRKTRRDLPVQKPPRLCFQRDKWNYQFKSGKYSTLGTVDDAYDAALRDGYRPPDPVVFNDLNDDDDDDDDSDSDSSSSDDSRPPTKRRGVSDAAWAEVRETRRDLPVKKPPRMFYQRNKWNYQYKSGKYTHLGTVDDAYNAAKEDGYRPPDDDDSSDDDDDIESAASIDDRPQSRSDVMWDRDRKTSFLDLPEKRPKRLIFANPNGKWQIKTAEKRTTYPSLDAAYTALVYPS